MSETPSVRRIWQQALAGAWLPVLFLLLLPLAGRAQGWINVNNRNLNPAQWVFRPSDYGSLGSALTGTNWVAELVYGGSRDALGRVLGARMPFRVSTTTASGTWNPGQDSVRAVPGSDPGATVWMQVRVWDSWRFETWDAAMDAVRNGTAGSPWDWGFPGGGPPPTYLGKSEPFPCVLGDASWGFTNLLTGFRSFTLVPAWSFVPDPPTPCVDTAADVEWILPWNGGTTNLNLLPYLAQYRSAARPSTSPEIVSNTPVSQLFGFPSQDSGLSQLISLTGTLGDARVVIRSNLLGSVTNALARSLGYEPYSNGGIPVCGLDSGSLIVRVVPPVSRPMLLTVTPLLEDRYRLTLSGLPNTSYDIRVTQDLRTFQPFFRSTTGMDGRMSALFLYPNVFNLPAIRFFRVIGPGE